MTRVTITVIPDYDVIDSATKLAMAGGLVHEAEKGRAEEDEDRNSLWYVSRLHFRVAYLYRRSSALEKSCGLIWPEQSGDESDLTEFENSSNLALSDVTDTDGLSDGSGVQEKEGREGTKAAGRCAAQLLLCRPAY